METLPEAIRNNLTTLLTKCVIDESQIHINVEKINTNDIISAAWKIKVIETVSRCRKLELFVKYLNYSNGYFTQEAIKHFENELTFYGDLLKLFERLGNSNLINFTAKCFSTSSIGTNPYIIMEDLTTNYHPLNIQKPLNFDEAKIVLENLGIFHAYSFAARDKFPSEFKQIVSKLEETVFHENNRSTVGRIFTGAIWDAFKLAKQALPSDSIYVDKMTDFVLNCFENMTELVKGDENDKQYQVITHGDLWPSNILLNKESQKAVFIDFQGCRLASPVHDLMLVLLIALDRQTRHQYQQELIAHYHHSLCTTLKDRLNCNPLHLFPHAALQRQLARHTQFPLALALVGLPLYLNDMSSAAATNLRRVDEVQDERNDIEIEVGQVTIGARSNLPINALESAGKVKSGNVEAKHDNELDNLLAFAGNVRKNKTMQCKNKMLDVLMDVIDQGFL